MLGAPNNVMLHRGEHFPHNYNAVSRSAFYTWLNRHFKLGFQEPVIERDYEPLERDQLTVWDEQHPAPKADDPDFERKLLKWFADDAEQAAARSRRLARPISARSSAPPWKCSSAARSPPRATSSGSSRTSTTAAATSR